MHLQAREMRSWVSCLTDRGTSPAMLRNQGSQTGANGMPDLAKKSSATLGTAICSAQVA